MVPWWVLLIGPGFFWNWGCRKVFDAKAVLALFAARALVEAARRGAEGKGGMSSEEELMKMSNARDECTIGLDACM